MNSRQSRSCLWAFFLAFSLLTHARAEAWRFIVVGDTRTNNATAGNGVNTIILGELASAIVNEQASLVLMPGDLAYQGSNAAYTTWTNSMAPVYNNGIGVYTVRGNHDLNNDPSAYFRYFTNNVPQNGPAGELGVTYSFTFNNALFLNLDNYASSLHVNTGWVNQVLSANNSPAVFAMGHEPAFSVNHADCLDDNLGTRDYFWEALAAAGGRTYFAGHDHFYDHALINNGDGNPSNDLHQFVVGPGGAPFSPWDGLYDGANSSYTPSNIFHEAQYGYLVVDVTDTDVTMTWKHRVAPNVYTAGGDVFTYAIPEPSTYALVVGGLLALIRFRRRR